MPFLKQVIFCIVLILSSTMTDAKILFTVRHDIHKGDEGVYVMDDNGDNVTQLRRNEIREKYESRWAINGELIGLMIYHSHFGGLYLMNPDGSNIQKFIGPKELKADLGKFAFSPDGNYIVFSMIQEINRKNVRSVRVINIKTRKIKKIADDLNIAQLDWSPDGKYIIFSTPVQLGGERAGNSIYIMDADGDNIREVLAPPIGDELNIGRWAPKWSSDGRYFVYRQIDYTWEERKPEIVSMITKAFRYFIADKDGNTVKRLNIPIDISCIDIDWMDDDKSIVFTGRKAALNELPLGWGENPPHTIYKYNIKTGEMKRLTDFEGDHFYIDWISDDVLSVSPEGKKPTQWGTIK
ncbi:PD40 domain-containing protein [Candidatus Poribacteria bacterium]|nr:PD40 domain-containing protein [Candidatus Poribacteria bacterium]